MGVHERKAREKQELRQDILDAARDLFVEQGYEAVSMRKIAERIEYSPTTIYLYFRDKAELFDHLCASVLEKLIARLIAAGDPHTDPLEALRAALQAYIDFGLQHPAHYRLTFMTPHTKSTRPSDQTPLSREAGQRAFSCLRDNLQRSMDAGRIRRADIEQTAQIAWASVHGLTSLLIAHPDFPWTDRDALIRNLVDTVLEGMR